MDIFIGLEVDCQMIYLQKDIWPISSLKDFACTSDTLSLAIVIKWFTFAWQLPVSYKIYIIFYQNYF